MPSKDLLITRAEILERFDTVIRNHIQTNTNAPSESVSLGNSAVTLDTATAGAIQNPGLPSASTVSTNIAELVSNNTSSATGIARNLVNLMRTYALSYKIRIRNSSSSTINANTFTDSFTGRFTAAPNATLLNNVENDVLAALANRGISTNSATIDASDFEAFLTDCGDIWNSRCDNTQLREFVYTFCHSSHSNHVNHGSRGRR